MDAFWNYLTGLKENKKFDKFWPANVQLMAKDIIRVHATIWPALLLALDYKLPKNLFVHGYFTIDGQKMGKSLSNVISPINLTGKYGVDSLRYFLIREIHFGEDGDFSEDALKNRVNNELANDLGNLLNRSVVLGEKFKGKINGEKELEKKLNVKNIEKLMNEFKLTEALDEIWKFVKGCNKYTNDREPWKKEGKELENILYNLLESLRIISILIGPFMPETSEKIKKQLGVKEETLKDCKFKEFKGKIKKGEILFNKV